MRSFWDQAQTFQQLKTTAASRTSSYWLTTQFLQQPNATSAQRATRSIRSRSRAKSQHGTENPWSELIRRARSSHGPRNFTKASSKSQAILTKQANNQTTWCTLDAPRRLSFCRITWHNWASKCLRIRTGQKFSWETRIKIITTCRSLVGRERVQISCITTRKTSRCGRWLTRLMVKKLMEPTSMMFCWLQSATAAWSNNSQSP